MCFVALLLQLAGDGFQFVLNPVAFPAHGVRLTNQGGVVVEVRGQVQGLRARADRDAGLAQGRLSLLQVPGDN